MEKGELKPNMNYHDIETDNMLNGDGLRVVLWVAGCEHHCKNCQNPITWDPDGGLIFDEKAEDELFTELQKPYISGITFSGGDPLHPKNRESVLRLATIAKSLYDKTVWLYTGYEWEQIYTLPGIENIDILVDGKFVQELADVNYPWAGSTNQRVIDVKKSLERGCAIKYKVEEGEIYHEDLSRCDPGKCC